MTSPSPTLPIFSGISDEMRLLLDGQRKVHESILKLQAQIEEEEAFYLEETSHGNIIRGWDGFIDSKQSRKDTTLKKIKPYTEGEHLFSSCCVYGTQCEEPTLDLIDYNQTAGPSKRQLPVANEASTPTGTGTPVSGTGSLRRRASMGLMGQTNSLFTSGRSSKLDRKGFGSATSSPAASTLVSTPTTGGTVGRPLKVKKRKRFPFDISSTTSATQSEAGDGEDVQITSKQHSNDVEDDMIEEI